MKSAIVALFVAVVMVFCQAISVSGAGEETIVVAVTGPDWRLEVRYEDEEAPDCSAHFVMLDDLEWLAEFTDQ